MKAQCVHSDTGLCETCFNYENQLADSREVLKRIIDVPKWTDLEEYPCGQVDKMCEIAEEALNKVEIKPKEAQKGMGLIDIVKIMRKIEPIDLNGDKIGKIYESQYNELAQAILDKIGR
jgi:hypothetical protein